MRERRYTIADDSSTSSSVVDSTHGLVTLRSSSVLYKSMSYQSFMILWKGKACVLVTYPYSQRNHLITDIEGFGNKRSSYSLKTKSISDQHIWLSCGNWRQWKAAIPVELVSVTRLDITAHTVSKKTLSWTMYVCYTQLAHLKKSTLHVTQWRLTFWYGPTRKRRCTYLSTRLVLPTLSLPSMTTLASTLMAVMIVWVFWLIHYTEMTKTTFVYWVDISWP